MAKVLIAVAGVASAAALLLPNPGGDMELKEFECRVRVNAKAVSPFANDFLRVVIRNNTATAIEVKSRLPCGIDGYFDVEVQNADGKRVSAAFYEAGLASPFAKDEVVATLKPRQESTFEISPMRPIHQSALRPGKYRCRVRFRYDKIDVTSEFVDFTVTEQQIKDDEVIGIDPVTGHVVKRGDKK